MSVRLLLLAGAASFTTSACFLDAVGVGGDDGGGGAGGGPVDPVTSSTTGGAPSTGGGPEGGGGGEPMPCGDGEIEPGEECDGDPDCAANCTIDPDSVCFMAPSLDQGVTTVTLDGSSPTSFGSFSSFAGTSCRTVSDDLPAAIHRYEIPSPHAEGIFISATALSGGSPVLWAHRGCGAVPVGCSRGNANFTTLSLRVGPPGNVFFVGVAEASGALEGLSIYARPFRFFDSFVAEPVDWNLSGNWVWNEPGGSLDLPSGDGDVLESSDVVIDALDAVWVGLGYETGLGSGGTVEVSYDGGSYAPIGNLPLDAFGTWTDLETTPPAGAQNVRVRVVGSPELSISAVMIGPVVPAR